MPFSFVEGVRKMGDLYKSRLNNSLHHSSYRPGDRVVLEVRFPAGDKTYCYDADPGIYYPGDKVFVKIKDGYKDVTVVKAYYFDNHDYPFYTLPLKSIAGRANDTDYSYSSSTKGKVPEKTNDTKAIDILTSEILSNKDDRVQEEAAPEKTQYRSYESNEKPKSNKLLIALIIVAIIGVLQGPTWYRNYLDSQPLYNTDLVGMWESEYGSQEIDFKSDHSAEIKGSDYLSGKWEISSETDQTIRLRYFVTDYQLDLYNEEFSYEMDGYIATKDDVLEWETEYNEELPPEGVYRFKRSTNRLIYSDWDYYLEKR